VSENESLKKTILDQYEELRVMRGTFARPDKMPMSIPSLQSFQLFQQQMLFGMMGMGNPVAGAGLPKWTQ
jgi:hypothetical protein